MNTLKESRMKLSLKELCEYEKLDYGTIVKVFVGDEIFEGKIVGQGADGPNPIYLVECTDGFIPNNTYRYGVCMIALSEMRPINQ